MRSASVAMAIGFAASARGSVRGRIRSQTQNSTTTPAPKTHSTCTFAQIATRSGTQRSGRAERAARARSISHTHAAMPANENTCGRGSARGSRISQPNTHTASAAAPDARTRLARTISQSVAASRSACTAWIAALPPRVHRKYAPKSKSHEVYGWG